MGSGYYDYSPYGEVGATVVFISRYGEHTEGLHPDALDWHSEGLLTGVEDELAWGTDDEWHLVAVAVLKHRLGHDPDAEMVEAFMETIASQWRDGSPWVLYSGELQHHLGI